jgi:hypothetical protein
MNNQLTDSRMNKNKSHRACMKFDVLTAVNMKITVFWLVTPCCLEKLKGYPSTLVATRSSETSAPLYKTKRVTFQKQLYSRGGGRFFKIHLILPAALTLGLTQPLTEMSTRNL